MITQPLSSLPRRAPAPCHPSAFLTAGKSLALRAPYGEIPHIRALLPAVFHLLIAIFRTAIVLMAIFSPALLFFPGNARADIDDNLKGVPPSELSEWHYHGITEKESKRWIEAGIIFAAWAGQWRGEGFDPESAGRWRKIANVYTAGRFLRNGFGPEEAAEWMRHGVKSGERAREYHAAGLGPSEAGTFWKKGLYPDEAKQWRNAGFSAEKMLEWRYGPRMSAFYFTKGTPYSRTVYELAFAEEWKNAGFMPREAQQAAAYGLVLAEAKKWKDAGFSFGETVFWNDSGFSLEEAEAGRSAGLNAGEAELKRYDSSSKGDEITELSTEITVNRDGTLEVEEMVTIIDRPGGAYSGGYYKSVEAAECGISNSRKVFPESRVEVKSVEVDGLPGSHAFSEDALHLRGTDGPLSEGEHRIRLTYTTESIVMNGPHHDEFCFVIAGRISKGSYIRNASATVRLPKGADLIFADGYAGLRERKDFVSETEETGQGDIVRYSATRPLREGMTFSVNPGFVKGYAEASLLRKLVLLDRQTLRFPTSLLIFASGLVVCFFSYWVAWFRVGRDPKGRGAAATEFSPPDEIDPSMMRAFMNRGKADHLSVTAELLSLAERGFITISESEGIYRIGKTEKNPYQLPGRESDFLSGLFHDRNMLILTGRSRQKELSRAFLGLGKSLKSEYRKQSEHNLRYLMPGVVVSVLFFLAALFRIDLGGLFDNNKGGTTLAFYAAFLCGGFGLLALLFARLLRRPAGEHVDLMARVLAYAGFLDLNFSGQAARALVPPFLREHLPYAVAAGIDVSRMLIRGGEAEWYRGAAGGFGCGDFITAVERSL